VKKKLMKRRCLGLKYHLIKVEEDVVVEVEVEVEEEEEEDEKKYHWFLKVKEY
jgi:hypothetical protein